VVEVKITYLAHSCFLITAADGIRILMDPYESGSYDGAVQYGPVREAADLVLISHDTHPDHAASDSIPGSPTVIKQPGEAEVKGIKIDGIATFHDPSGGRERGPNTVFNFEVDGLKICHLGDLGHVLNADQMEAIGRPDVLMVPVGGYFTIDANEAAQVVRQLNPRITIPMHFKTEKLGFPIAGREEFLATQGNVVQTGESEVEVIAGELGDERRVIVLDPSL
jgi:L-ascorbate metabolism protein UlaG (beta-lactamase superfamily)